MPREQIAMSPDEVVAFLARHTHCVVATLDRDGSPWGDAAPCLLRDGRLYFRLPAGSRSHRNLEADPRVCCTVESQGEVHYGNVAVMAHGDAVPVADGAAPAELDVLPDPVTGTPSAGPVFSVDLDHVVSFDFAKIQRRFEHD